MIRNSIVVKLWLTFIVFVVVVLSLLSVFLEQLLDNYFSHQQTIALASKSKYVTQILKDNADNQQNVLQILTILSNEEPKTAILPLAPDDPKIDGILNLLTADQKQSVMNGEPVVFKNEHLKFQNVPPGKENLWAISALLWNGQFRGLLVLNQLVTITEPAIKSAQMLIFFAASFGIVLTTGLAFVVSKNLSRPLIQMNQVAERMAEGDFEGEIEIVTGDEVGQLGKTLNKMTAALRSTIQELMKQSEQSSGILTSMADGVISADLEGRIVLVNPQASKLLQYTLDHTTQSSNQFEVGQTLPNDLLELKEAVIQAESPVERELNWQGNYIDVAMTPLFQPGKREMRGIVAVLRDITKERMLEEMRRDFVANVSHELRTPLALLQGYSEALQDEFGDDPVQRKELTGIILEETHRMRRLVEDLLDLAQMQSSHFLLQEETVSMDTLCKRVARKFSTLAAEKQIKFSYSNEAGNWYVKGDEDRLEQVLTNLLDNAIRHTSENGCVTLKSILHEEVGRLEVTDTGSGIPPEALPFIFERFYKVDKARTRSKGGTGLGLAIASNIVKGHGGTISVRSKVGEGTTFIVELPRLNPPHSELQLQQA